MYELIKKIMVSFFLIATGTLISATFFITFLVPNATFGVEILWQILAFPFFTAPLSIVFYSKKELSKKALLLRQIAHYLLINIILLSCAYFFEWVNFKSLVQVITFLFLVFIVYIGVWICCLANDNKEANRLNKKIQEYQSRKE